MTHGRVARSGVAAGRGMNRREFLKLGGAGLAGAALLGSAACGGSSSGSGDLIFAMGTDTSGTLEPLVEKFNKQSKDFKVTYRAMPTDSGAYFDKLRTQFQAGGGDIDVIGADIVWPAQFAANGWILDVTDRFPKSAQADFLRTPLQTLVYEGKMYGVPWFADAGLLYYRQDLVEKAGYTDPPKTWPELQEMADKITQDEGIENGFIFQGDQYEGGVCNGCEYIWTHGGNIFDPADSSKVVIDSPEAIEGLTTEQNLVADGVAPKSVATTQETTTDPIFLGGKAVFTRNWPYMYGLAGTEAFPKVKPDQIGIAPLPVAPGNALGSAQGGWDMVINAQTDMPDEAWEFVQWMTAEEQQKWRALKGSFLPTRPTLFSDPEIRDTLPVVVQGEESLKNARARPVSPYYSDMSLEMQEQFNAVVSGDTSPEAAVASLQQSLEQIVEAGG
jgi:multiple sugar transport system substrate-binding protein